METTRWWWLRHAPVLHQDGCIYGHMDVEIDLSDAGLLARIAGELPEAPVFLSSPVARARNTLDALCRVGGLDAGPVEAVDDLAEQNFGNWQGRHYDEIFADMPIDAWDKPASMRPPDGEDFEQMTARVGRAIDGLTERFAGRDIVIVAHAGTIRAAIAKARSITPDKALAIGIDTLSLTRIDAVGAPGGTWQVVYINKLLEAV